MEKTMFAAALLVLSGCAHTTYTEATRCDPSIVRHVVTGLKASDTWASFCCLKASNHSGF